MLTLVVLGGSLLAARASGQLKIAIGGRYTSNLVRDSIVTPFTLRPDVAPAGAFSLAIVTGTPWRWYATLDASYSRMRRHEADGSTLDVQGLFAAGLAAELERTIVPGLDARVGVGGLIYVTEESGIFRLGTGGIHPIVLLGARYAPPFAARLGLALDARYDVQRFNTRALKNAGFLDGRLVSRLMVGVSRRVP